jgi:hypothetical protein
MDPAPNGAACILGRDALLQVSLDLLISGTTDASGNARIALPVPGPTPYSTYYAQFVVRDSGAPNVGGISSTRAGKLVIW